MKIPSKVKIGGHVFTVTQVEMKDLGDTTLEDLEIRINKDAKQSQKEATLLHEIICHCLNTTLGHKKGMHEVLDGLSEQLYQVLKDNNFIN